MTSVEFEPAIPANEQLQSHALDRATTIQLSKLCQQIQFLPNGKQVVSSLQTPISNAVTGKLKIC
jgi:hypothetical protein